MAVLYLLCHVCWKLELWRQHRQPLLGNGSANMPVSRQWFRKRHKTEGHAYVRNNKTVEISDFYAVLAESVQYVRVPIQTPSIIT
jgi:hypothetical protein